MFLSLQGGVTCRRLRFRESYRSRRCQEHGVPWGPGRPTLHIPDQRVSVLCPLSLGQSLLTASEVYLPQLMNFILEL